MKYSWIFLIGCLQLFGNHVSLVAQDKDIYFESLVTEQPLSQLTVSSIFQDSKGFIWFGTLDGLNRYDGYSIKVFKSLADKPESISSNYINSITEDSLGYLWIGTDNGLNRLCRDNDEFLRFFKEKEKEYNISHNKVSFVYRDKLDRIWIGTEQGLDCVNQETLTFTKRTFNNFLFNNRIITIHDDSYGNLWIGTLRGLVKYDTNTDKHLVFLHESGNPNSISNNHIRSIFEDSRKNLWIGTSDGLNLYDTKNNNFRHFGKTIYPDLTLTNNAVKSIVEDEYHNLLIGTNKGLNIFNLDNKTIKKYVPDKIIPGSLNHSFIYSLYIDNAGTVWIGTFNGGVNYFNRKYTLFRYINPANDLVYGNINKIFLKDNSLWIGTDGEGLLQYDLQFLLKKQHLFHAETRQSNSSNCIYSITEMNNSLLLGTGTNQLLLFDLNSKKIIETINGIGGIGIINDAYKTKDGDLLFCVNDTIGLRKLNPSKKRIEPVTYLSERNREMLFPFPTCIIEESPGVFWIGTRYAGLYYYNSNSQSVKRYVAGIDSISLRSNSISAVYIDNLNNLWIGTTDSGLFRFSSETESFRAYNINHGLPHLDIRGILEDEAGYIWLATFFGVSRFDLTQNKFINFNKDNGFPLQEISKHSFTLLENGCIAVGGNNGFTVFNPLDIKFDTFIPPVLITNFRLLNSGYSGNAPKIELLMNKEKVIELKHNQSNFIIEFAALNYIFPKNTQYAYKLEGFDAEWNYVGKQRTAAYTNLNAGNYIFRVKALINNGMWSENQKALTIKVHPPLWKTGWAYLIYILVAGGLLFLSFRYFRFKNANRLKLLVDQLADFRERESGKIELNVSEGRFNRFITEIALAFNPLALKQEINYQIEISKETIFLWFDRHLLEKVFCNLLSNAFNNTPTSGTVTISVEKYDKTRLKDLLPEIQNILVNTGATEFVETRIKNSKKEIPDKEYGENLNPFYRMKGDTRQSQIGTNIGLGLVKGITELHHGIVSVDNTLEEWTIFRIILPVGREHLSSDEILHEDITNHHILGESCEVETFVPKIENNVHIHRERMKQSMREKTLHELTSTETVSMDEQFLNKINQIVEKNISNPHFMIDDLSKEVGMSRSSLYRKIKSLTNYSTNEYIKNYRLHVASKYLRETDLSVSEIAYKTGFNNPAYFTNCFRKFFKTSPSNYMRNLEKLNNRQQLK